jgi:geranylgeranyl diphosphate synthase type II
MNLASPAQLAQMKAWMEREEYDAAEKIAWFTALYNELGVKEVCERRIRELFAKCDAYIDAISVAPEKKSALKSFANMILDRNL